ncbi:MAG: hypothetical protein GTO63_18350 [Anaerolineae bacterium]|nr:hypothetical protein [Anaerolineae bacterium]NIN96732.1 hypothetical protein [Anaerolineae bacterium]
MPELSDLLKHAAKYTTEIVDQPKDGGPKPLSARLQRGLLAKELFGKSLSKEEEALLDEAGIDTVTPEVIEILERSE